MGLFKHLKRDYERQAASHGHRAFLSLAVYRFGRWSKGQVAPVRWATSKMYGAAFLISEAVTGIHLGRDTEVGEDLHFVHAGGINIHPDTVIGDRVGIMPGVTIGTDGSDGGLPVIGNDVFIGSNASIIGPVKIGDGARVAANSLVLTHVPAGATAIGVPAKIIPAMAVHSRSS